LLPGNIGSPARFFLRIKGIIPNTSSILAMSVGRMLTHCNNGMT
jgi:hypothetical protein